MNARHTAEPSSSSLVACNAMASDLQYFFAILCLPLSPLRFAFCQVNFKVLLGAFSRRCCCRRRRIRKKVEHE